MKRVSNHSLVVVLFVLFVFFHSAARSLECVDLYLDSSLALSKSTTVDLVLQGLRLPVLRLFCGLERRVLPDGSIGVGVNLLNVLRSDTVSEICRELLLEAVRYSSVK